MGDSAVPESRVSIPLGHLLAFVSVSYTHLDVYKRQWQGYPIPSDPGREWIVSDQGRNDGSGSARLSLVRHAVRIGSIRRLPLQGIPT